MQRLMYYPAMLVSRMRDLRFRSKVFADSSTRTLSSISLHLLSDIRGLIGILRWLLFPGRYSIAHMDYDARLLSPFGHRWGPDGNGRTICTGCHTGHPMDFLEFAVAHGRWNPAAAHEEALELIGRGEMADTSENHNRWANIPEDMAVMWSAPTPNPESALPMLVALNYMGDYYSTCLSHLGDLREWEFDLFASWAAEVMPEWDLSREGTMLHSHYNGSEDPMAGVNPYAFLNPANQPASATQGVVVIQVHEEDYDE